MNMNILVKAVDMLCSTIQQDSKVIEYLIYLRDDNNNNLLCDVAYGENMRIQKRDEMKVKYNITEIQEYSFQDFFEDYLNEKI